MMFKTGIFFMISMGSRNNSFLLNQDNRLMKGIKEIPVFQGWFLDFYSKSIY
jgi:hypothetical protein